MVQFLLENEADAEKVDGFGSSPLHEAASFGHTEVSMQKRGRQGERGGGGEVEGRWRGGGGEVEGRWRGGGGEVEGRWRGGGGEVEGRWRGGGVEGKAGAEERSREETSFVYNYDRLFEN